ncbi:Msa family membrane protein [Staphylococcus schleiferi]|uniref:Msa family membrane protein n=1 Tax=Staphylococcus schleiferi TaxID=1295 RepID=UPI00248070D4|nr:Msa family membrane protein [Staphylococcus schleiferi]
MKMNYKAALFALFLNILFSILMFILKFNIGLMIMAFTIILVPVLINILSLFMSKESYNILTLLTMSVFNIAYYVTSANTILNNSHFQIFACHYSYETNGSIMNLKEHSLSIPHLIVFFLLYFVLSLLCAKIYSKSLKLK